MTSQRVDEPWYPIDSLSRYLIASLPHQLIDSFARYLTRLLYTV